MSTNHHDEGQRRGVQAMERSDRQLDEARPARLAAADDACRFLIDNFVQETAMAVAVRVEYFLATQWEIEQEQMRARRDPKQVFEISFGEIERARNAAAGVPVDRSDAHAEQHVLDLFAQFPADQAWWTAHRAREKIEAWCRWRATQSVKQTGAGCALS